MTMPGIRSFALLFTAVRRGGLRRRTIIYRHVIVVEAVDSAAAEALGAHVLGRLLPAALGWEDQYVAAFEATRPMSVDEIIAIEPAEPR